MNKPCDTGWHGTDIDYPCLECGVMPEMHKGDWCIVAEVPDGARVTLDAPDKGYDGMMATVLSSGGFGKAVVRTDDGWQRLVSFTTEVFWHHS